MRPSLSRFAYYPKNKYTKFSVTIKNIFCNSQNSVQKNFFSKEIFTFNMRGTINQIVRIDKNNNETITNFRYDEDNNLTYINDEVWTFSFDNKSKKITIISGNKVNKWEKEYDDRNRRTKLSSFINNELCGYQVFEYDEKGRITKWLEYDSPMDDYGNDTDADIQLISEKKLNYKKQFQNRILCTFTDFDVIDKITSKQIYIINPDLTVDSHKYLDKNGNLTSEIKFEYKYENGELLEIKEKQINYRNNPNGIISIINQINYNYD